MKLYNINIKRFRSILNLEIEIDLKNNFITICGANNTGKTNILRALNVFFYPDQYNVEEDSPNHKYHGSRGGKSYPEIEVTFLIDEKYITITRLFGAAELTQTKGITVNQGKRENLSADACDELLSHCAFFFIPSINISFPKLINNLLDDVYDLEYQKTRFRGLKQKLKTSFDDYISGLLGILNQLAEEINPIFQEFNENWSVGFENTADVLKFKDLISEDIDFFLNDKSNRNIEGKGSGLQRLGYILLHSRIIEKLKKKCILIGIDEPDVYLHHGLQHKLKEHLEELSKKCQVLVTSHSPVFIDQYTLTNVFLLDLEIGEAIPYQRAGKSFHPVTTKLVDLYDHNGLAKIRQYLGIKSEDYELLDAYNIIVEGDSDERYLTELCNAFGIEIPRILPTHGATKIEKLLDFFDSFYSNRAIQPTTLVILDNDDAGRDVFRRIRKKIDDGTFKGIKVRVELLPNCWGETPSVPDVLSNKVKSNFEIEDFVYPELIVENANLLIKRKGLNQISYSKVKSRISAKSFKEKGILYNINLEKNERNLEDGFTLDFEHEGVKSGLSGLFALKANKKLSELLLVLDSQFPNVRHYLNRISNAELMR